MSDQSEGDVNVGKIPTEGADDAAGSSSDADVVQAAGDSSAGGYGEEIEIESWSWGKSASATDDAHDAERPGDVAAQPPPSEAQLPTENVSLTYEKVDINDAETPGLADPGTAEPDNADKG